MQETNIYAYITPIALLFIGLTLGLTLVLARVRFGDHAFAIPTDSSGKAVVLGALRAVEMSERDAKHMAADGGGDPRSVKGPQQEWELMATSVLIMADR